MNLSTTDDDDIEPAFRTGVKLKLNQSTEIEIPVTDGKRMAINILAPKKVSATLIESNETIAGKNLAETLEAAQTFRSISVEKPFQKGTWKLKLESKETEETEIAIVVLSSTNKGFIPKGECKMKQKIKLIFLSTLFIVIGYFVIGIIFHHYLFPLQKPDYASYFQSGDRFSSNWEAVEQTVISQEDGWLKMSSLLRPKADGPPVHIHENFDETFFVKEGTLSVLVNGEKKILRAGEKLQIPKGTAHKPFNETDLPVIIESAEGGKTFPVEFGYHLVQLLCFIDDLGENPNVLAIILQISIYGEDFDSWMADGTPIAMQKVLRFALAPTARLLGYKNHYEKYRIKH